MFERNCRSSLRPRRYCRCRRERGGYTYDSVLHNSRRTGITVETSASGFAAPILCREPAKTASMSCESGLLRYKNQWEYKDAEVVAGSHVLTGVAAFAAPDSLRVVSGRCSRFVPLEQVVCVRVDGGGE